MRERGRASKEGEEARCGWKGGGVKAEGEAQMEGRETGELRKVCSEE